jgi:Domain of unknown function (DUF4331)
MHTRVILRSTGRRQRWTVRAAVAATLLGAACAASASSHREAPFITEQPKVDATDFYLFRSYEPGRAGYVTLIANYLPLQAPYGGPNYFTLDPDALYEIHVDNDGDGVENVTFQLRFAQRRRDIALPVGGKDVAIPLVQAGQITSVRPATQNVYETYSVGVVRGPRRTGAVQWLTDVATGSAQFDKPIDNIGTKTLPDYAAYGAQFVHDVQIPGCGPGRVFVGQRKDPFVVNLGETFDLINVRFPAVEFDPDAESAETDSLAGANVTTLALEVPIGCVASAGEPVIGGWTSASLRQTRVLLYQGGTPDPRPPAAKELGGWVQVSRLGMPLVNEVVIGLRDKDRFNGSVPSQDGRFADYVTNPTLPALVELLYGSAGVKAPTNFPRTDLVTAFLTGVPGLNKPATVRPSEMLRLNTTVATTQPASQHRLGVLGGDLAGFPNGRRPGDDVVDIELRVAMGVLCTLDAPTVFGCRPADAPSGAIRFTDGAYLDAARFDARFPYLTLPLPGSPNGANGLPAKP